MAVHKKHFSIPISALLATGVSLAGYALCTWYEATKPWLVGLGLLMGFAGFVGVSLALILDSDHDGGEPSASLRE